MFIYEILFCDGKCIRQMSNDSKRMCMMSIQILEVTNGKEFTCTSVQICLCMEVWKFNSRVSQKSKCKISDPGGLVCRPRGSCYKFVYDEIVTQETSVESCQALGGHVVSIETEEEQQWLMKIISKTPGK